MPPSGSLRAIHRLTELKARANTSFSPRWFHNLTWLVSLSLSSHLFVPPLPPVPPAPIHCDLTAITHPPVGQLKLNYLPDWRGRGGGGVEEKRGNNDARFVRATACLPFEPAPLEVEEAALTAFQCHR